jgi:23S rRNA pseudouridine2605 synthase
MKNHSFEKFINQEKNSRKKEAIKQEKRKWKEEKKKKYEERSNRHEIKKSGTNFQKPKFETQTKSHNYRITDRSQPTSGKQQPATEIPLNKFIAHAGICSRREAAELVKEGKIKVNNSIIYEPGFKVTSDDKIVLMVSNCTFKKILFISY